MKILRSVWLHLVCQRSQNRVKVGVLLGAHDHAPACVAWPCSSDDIDANILPWKRKVTPNLKFIQELSCNLQGSLCGTAGPTPSLRRGVQPTWHCPRSSHLLEVGHHGGDKGTRCRPTDALGSGAERHIGRHAHGTHVFKALYAFTILTADWNASGACLSRSCR